MEQIKNGALWVFCEVQAGEILPVGLQLLGRAKTLAAESNKPLYAVVLGPIPQGGAKLLGAYIVYIIAVLASSLNIIALDIYGNTVNYGVIFGSYLSLLLIGLACIAIGVFVSSLTENQLVAAIVTMGILLVIIAISMFNSQIESDFLRAVLSWISLLDRYALFTYGMFDLSALIYYISIAGVFFFLTVRVFEKRRWE